MRLRGYSLMTNLLEEYSNDSELVFLVCGKVSFACFPFLSPLGAPMYVKLAIGESQQGGGLEGHLVCARHFPASRFETQHACPEGTPNNFAWISRFQLLLSSLLIGRVCRGTIGYPSGRFRCVIMLHSLSWF